MDVNLDKALKINEFTFTFTFFLLLMKVVSLILYIASFLGGRNIYVYQLCTFSFFSV
jgi:hypothetical protein